MLATKVMQSPETPRPLPGESKRATKERLRLIDICAGKLMVAEALVAVGSMAYARNHGVHQGSDLDLLVLVDPNNIGQVVNQDLFDGNEWKSTACSVFSTGTIGNFTLATYIDGTKIECHFWNKEFQYRASRLEIPYVTNLRRGNAETSKSHLDFSGRERHVPRNVRFEEGCYLCDYTVFAFSEGKFVPYEPVNNMVMTPKIVFAKDKQLEHNIDVMWSKLAAQLIKENPGEIDLSKTSILHSQPGNWKLSIESKSQIQERTEQELDRLGVSYIYSLPKDSILPVYL